MALPDRPERSGLTWRIFLATAGIVLAVLVVTLVSSSLSASRFADRSISAGLNTTAGEIDSLISREARAVAERTRAYFTNVELRSAIEQATDSGDYVDLAITAAEEIGVDWLQLIDDEGIRLARSDLPGAERADLSASPLVQAALEGEIARGFGLTSDSILFDAVAIPIEGAGGVVGVAMAARTIGDTLAREIGTRTGSDILFYSVDSTGTPRIVGATPGVGDRLQAARALQDQMMRDGPPMPPDSSLVSTMLPPAEVEIGDVHYVGSARPLTTRGGTVIGGVVALRNRDVLLQPYRAMQLGILGAAGLGLLFAVALALRVARQISSPVRSLAAAARRAADGDYEAEIPAGGRDEIGALATAFRRLLGDLREKQALVEFLQNPSGGRTVASHVVASSAPTATTGTGAITPGQVLGGRYEIRNVLGVGGMGMVYKAFDRELGEAVAIKTLKPDILAEDTGSLERFRSEIRLARRISHRNVVRTHDIGDSGGLYYISMELVEGRSLKDLIVSRGRLPAAAVVPIARQLARALEVAHEAGVIHRDIKPQNMVVEGDGVLKVMDFGIARLEQRTEGHTQAGLVVGTPEYMAPEQLTGLEIDARVDLYAAGVVFYECLTGRLPHDATTAVTLIVQVLEDVPPTPTSLVRDVPVPLSDLVMRLLSKKPEQRPASATELLAILDRM